MFANLIIFSYIVSERSKRLHGKGIFLGYFNAEISFNLKITYR